MAVATLGGRAMSGNEMPMPGPVAVRGDAWMCWQRLPLPCGHPCLRLQVLYGIGVGACSCDVYK